MYYSRLIEKIITEKLKYSGALLIAGPKYCGKTTTSSLFAKSVVKLISKQDIYMAEINPGFIMNGENPRLIDEWQLVPDIWNIVRNEVDEKNNYGMYILTGSSTPADKSEVYHSGAGRIVTLNMKPMTLAETLESTMEISIADMFNDVDINMQKEYQELKLIDTAYYICRGGWPKSIIKDRDVSLKITKNYYDGLFNFENSSNKKFRNKKTEIFKMVLKSYARNISTEASITTIQADVLSNNNKKVDVRTIDDYIDALKDIYILEDIEAWNTNLRSKTAIRTTNTRHFVDTSIACQALNISPDNLLNDLETFGLFFEDFAFKELSVYVSLLGGKINHYRDGDGLECDLVINLDDGRYALLEVKLGGETLIEDGVKSLNKLKEKIDYTKFNKPTFLAIITACGIPYKRADDIYVLPINCLKP